MLFHTDAAKSIYNKAIEGCRLAQKKIKRRDRRQNLFWAAVTLFKKYAEVYPTYLDI